MGYSKQGSPATKRTKHGEEESWGGIQSKESQAAASLKIFTTIIAAAAVKQNAGTHFSEKEKQWDIENKTGSWGGFQSEESQEAASFKIFTTITAAAAVQVKRGARKKNAGTHFSEKRQRNTENKAGHRLKEPKMGKGLGEEFKVQNNERRQV